MIMQQSPEKVPADLFMQIVRFTPLVSIDLLIYNEKDEVLLGWRTNQPARDWWFVPGGRIYKDESVRDAFSRIMEAETGQELGIDQTHFHGVYEHFHPGQNYMNEPGFGTHYVVLAFEVRMAARLNSLPAFQHSKYKWLTVPELLKEDLVHPLTKNYFNGYRSIG
jgi:colanic acid biosynthesis protein WcaH